MIKKIFFFLFVVFFVSGLAEARIYIVIDQAADKKFPIAVPRFLTESGRSASGLELKFEELLKKDLYLTDLLRVVSDEALPQDDHDVKDINFEKWRTLEIGALIKGIKTKVGSENVLQLRLYDVGAGEMILGKQYTITSKNYVDATHRFADAVMQALTGFRGPFESKIVAACGAAGKHQLATFEMDGERRGGIVKGSKNNMSPSWSPDGSQVAYISFGSGFPEAWVSAGGQGQQVTKFGNTTVTPVWTPDGKNLIVGTGESNTDLFVVNLSGKVLHQITRAYNIDMFPSLSPDGRIVFSSERAGDLHLFQTASGGGAKRLTYVGYQNVEPDWSPDGTKIAFASREKASGFSVFIMDADGSNIVRLTNEGNNESPVWSPDSRYLAYSSSRGGIYFMLEGGENEFLIPKSSGCNNLDWGPWLSKE